KLLKYNFWALIFSFSGGLMVLSCSEDFLEKSPKAQLTEDSFFETAEHASQAVNAIYSHLRNFSVHVFAYIGVTDIASDDAEKGSVPGDAGFLQDINDFTFDANNTATAGLWGGYYQGVFRANQVIQNVPNIEMDETLKNRLIGEARFLRA